MARTYSRDYKREAADRVIDGGQTVKGCARELGISPSTLDDWVVKRKLERATGARSSDSGELARLRARVRRLESSCDALRRALACLAAMDE